MGKKQSKPFRKTPIQKFKFELVLKKVNMHVKLQRDRRTGVLRKKEKQLLQLLNRKSRNQKDEYIKGSSIVADQSFIDACNIAMRFIDILNDKSINIVESKGDHTKIQEIVPYLISVLWVGKPLNIPAFGELYNMMYGFFGPGVQVCIEQENQVDAELKALFKNLMPSPQEVNLYFRKFCDKYDLDVDKFNSVGHQAPCGDILGQFVPSYPGAQFQQGGMGNPGGMPGPMNPGHGGGGMMMGGGQQMGPGQPCIQPPPMPNFMGGQGQMGQMPGGQQPGGGFPMPMQNPGIGGMGNPGVPLQGQGQGGNTQYFTSQQPVFQQPVVQPQQPMQQGQPQDQFQNFSLDNMQKFDDVNPGQPGQYKTDTDLFADIDKILNEGNGGQQPQNGGQGGLPQNQMGGNQGGYNMGYPSTDGLPQPGQKPYVPQQPGAFPPPNM